MKDISSQDGSCLRMAGNAIVKFHGDGIALEMTGDGIVVRGFVITPDHFEGAFILPTACGGNLAGPQVAHGYFGRGARQGAFAVHPFAQTTPHGISVFVICQYYVTILTVELEGSSSQPGGGWLDLKSSSGNPGCGGRGGRWRG